MRRIRIQNPILDATFKTYLSADYSSGTALSVLSNVSFATDDILVVGEPTEELTEAKRETALVSTTGFTLQSTLNFAHSKGTPVYKTIWDKVSIESRSSSAGVFAEIVSTNIQWDSKTNETIYFDANGTDTYEYRFRFYNSVTSTYSEYSPTLSGTGFTRRMAGYMIREVRKITNTPDQSIVTDLEIMRQFNRAQDIIYSHNAKYYFLLVNSYKQSDGIATIADTSVYSLAQYENFGHLDRVMFLFSSGGSDALYALTKKSESEFDYDASNLNQGNNDNAISYKLLPADSNSDNGYLQIYPTPLTSAVGTLYPNYYERMADLDDVADETQVPIPGILEDYAIAYVFRIKGDETKAKMYESGLLSDNPNLVPKHLLLLDKMDAAQKSSQGQPKSLSVFRGQRGMRRYYGNNRFTSTDYYKENYLDESEYR